MIIWKALPEFLGGDKDLLRKYKDAWVRSHGRTIRRLSAKYRFPPLLLAGVAWIEVGGDPDWIDHAAYLIRSFDHIADTYLEPLTITRKPDLTSLGDVSIQIRRAAESLGMDPDKLSPEQRKQLIGCLADEGANLNIVAEHLKRLRDVDFKDSIFFSEDQIRIAASRYNRGSELPISEIRRNTSYGDFVLKHRDHILSLLGDSHEAD